MAVKFLTIFSNMILSSPTGQQFVSCKEVSSYLLALCGPHNASWSSFDHIDGSVQFTDQITSGNVSSCLYYLFYTLQLPV